MPNTESIIWGLVVFAFMKGFDLLADFFKGKFKSNDSTDKELSIAVTSLKEVVIELKAIVTHEGKVSKEQYAKTERRLDTMDSKINKLFTRQSVLSDWKERKDNETN